MRLIATAITTMLLATVMPAGPVVAHPHVFAEARLEVAVDAGGQVQALRHLWRFDDLFSSTVLLEFDRNLDLALDHDELEEIAATVHASLAEFGYFQFVTSDGEDVVMQPPDRLMAHFEDQQLIILFESRPRHSFRLEGQIGFGVYDPTFYTAIEFIEDANLDVQDLPAHCTRTVVRPDPDEAIAQNLDMLTEDFFNQPDGNDMSKIFATRLELTCNADD